MRITLKNIKPTYMSRNEVTPSDIYLQEDVIFDKGRTYLIKASSGHGKTSLLNFIYGSNCNYDGEITYTSHNQYQVFKLRKEKISYIFQDFKLFPDLSVFENIQLKNELTYQKSIDEIDSLINLVGLRHKRDSLVKTLSLGQKQRVAIIRALCQPFDFLLLDEPFSHLDIKNIEIITAIINEEIEHQDASLIITSLGNSYFFKYDKILDL